MNLSVFDHAQIWAPALVSGGLFIGMLFLALDIVNVQLKLRGKSRVRGNILAFLVSLLIALFVFSVFFL